MARPNKQGLEYFPFDVDIDMDDKLAMVIGEYGSAGEILYVKLLTWIYKHQGYYVEWTEQEQLKFCKRFSYLGIALDKINEVVGRCIRWGLFDARLYDAAKILTSIRIQKTWFDVSRKRKDRQIDAEIWLLGVNGGNNPAETQLMAEETTKKTEETTQSKGKEIKEIINSGEPATPAPASTPSIKLEEKRRLMKSRQDAFYQSLVPHVGQYGKEMIRAFFNYWSEPNKSQTKFKQEMEITWEIGGRLATWEKNQYKFSKGKNPNNEQQPSAVNERIKATIAAAQQGSQA
jgi:hypothetical protein